MFDFQNFTCKNCKEIDFRRPRYTVTIEKANMSIHGIPWTVSIIF